MNRIEPLAMDVRMMNTATVILFLVFVLASLLAMTRWAAAHNAFEFQRITVLGDVNHCNAALKPFPGCGMLRCIVIFRIACACNCRNTR